MIIGVSIMRRVYNASLHFYRAKITKRIKRRTAVWVQSGSTDQTRMHSVKAVKSAIGLTTSHKLHRAVIPTLSMQDGRPTNKLLNRTTSFQKHGSSYNFLLTIRNNAECLSTILTLTICDLAAKTAHTGATTTSSNVVDYARVLSNLPYHKRLQRILLRTCVSC